MTASTCPACARPAFPRREIRLRPREAQILPLVVEGLSNEEIGRKLFIGVNTVKTYITRIYRTLGVHNRVSMVVEAIRLGLVDIDL